MNIITYVTAATAPQVRQRPELPIVNPPGLEQFRSALLEALIGVGIEPDPLDPPEEWLELNSLTRRCQIHALYSVDQGRSHLQVGFQWAAAPAAQANDHLPPEAPLETMVWLRFVGSFAGTAAPDRRSAAAWASQVDALVRQYLPSVNWRPPEMGFALSVMATNGPPDMTLCTASQEGSLTLSAARLSPGPGPAAPNRLWTLARQVKAAWPAWEASLTTLAPLPPDAARAEAKEAALRV